jgi:hypothetical protein
MLRKLQTLFGRAAAQGQPSADDSFQQALALHQQGELDKAERLYESVLALQPGHFAALNFLGILASQTNRPQRAVELLSKAIAVDPGQAGAHSNLALALNAVGRGRDAIDSCDRAIALDPDCVEAHSNRGNSLWGLGRRDEALASYARTLSVDPDHAQTHWNEGFLRLQLGQFEAGWPKQEWRWQLPHMAASRRNFAQPLWLGKESIAGKTILLHAEQGLGDTIQFCRYAKPVAALGATVVLEVQKPLKALLANLEGPSIVLAHGEPLPAFDCHCPLMSLPLAFGTTLASIPAARGYVRCDPQSVARWRTRLGPARGRRVGLAWRSGPSDERSVPVQDMLALVTHDAQFVCLQKDLNAEERKVLGGRDNVICPVDQLEDFSDTAALTSLLDVVVAIDTSVAHLAGAMDKPTWVPLLYNASWRWLLDREDCPWYPGMRLFRQPAPEDWGSVVARMAGELRRPGIFSKSGT